jgi:NADH:ubiquinone oxidoreductase subunit 2 (subunit N)
MIFNLQNYIITLIEQQNTSIKVYISQNAQTFLGLVPKNDFKNNLMYAQDFISNEQLLNAIVLFFPDIILYLGIVVLIFKLGLGFKKIATNKLFLELNQISKKIMVVAFLFLCVQWILIYKEINLSFSILNFNLNIFYYINWSYGFTIFNEILKINLYTQTVKLLVLFVALFLLNFMPVFLNSKNKINANEVSLLIHILICLAFTLASCNNFALLLLTLESFSLILYIMATLDRTQGGIIASVKYFVFGTLGSIFLFWGVAHIYALLPSLNYKVFYFLLEYNNAKFFDNIPLSNSLEFILTCILFGFIIKIVAAPLHAWVPDVYAGSHLLITAFFSTLIKLVLFLVFYAIAYHFNSSLIVDFTALCSLAVGTLLTLRQLEIKRFLAYSSITHVGFLLIGDLNSSFLYIITYVLSSLLFFSVLLSVKMYGYELAYFNDLKFIKKSGYWNVLLLTISLASMAVIPPFAGFFGKFAVWNSLIEDILLFNNFSSYFFLVISLSLSLVSIFYYVRVIAYIFVESDESFEISTENSWIVIQYTDLKPFIVFEKNAQQLQGALLMFIVFWTFVHAFFVTLSSEVSLCIIHF